MSPTMTSAVLVLGLSMRPLTVVFVATYSRGTFSSSFATPPTTPS